MKTMITKNLKSVRKMFLMTPEEDHLLKTLAATFNTSEGEVLRHALKKIAEKELGENLDNKSQDEQRIAA